MKARFQAGVALLFCAASSVASGCHLLSDRTAAGETRVGQGKVYHSDNPTYDEFFDGVHAVQTQAVDAVDEEAKARVPLEQALGTRNTTPERLVELTKQRVKGGREGPPIHVAVMGLEPKEGEPRKNVEVKVTVSDEAAVPVSQRELVKALEQSAKSEAEIVDRYGLVSTRAKNLLARHGQLVASVNKDFTTSSRRDEVSHELAASKSILGDAADRTDKVSGNARSFLKGMSEALSGNPDAAPGKEDKPMPGKLVAKPKNGKGEPEPKSAPPPKAAPPKNAAAPKPAPPAHKAKPEPAHPAPEAPKPEPAPKPAPPPKPPSEDFNP
jgi:hypothetical protein